MTDDLTARRELITLYRNFAARDAGQLPELAGALQDLANTAQGAGRLDEALTASAEAIEILRRLALTRADLSPVLAGDLLQRARWLLLADRSAEGEQVLAEADAAHRDMIGRFPAHALPQLGQGLMQTALTLREAGEYRVCLSLCEWAIEAGERARAASPDAVIFVASMLTVRSSVWAAAGRLPQALADARQSQALAEQFSNFDLNGSIGRTARELVRHLSGGS